MEGETMKTAAIINEFNTEDPARKEWLRQIRKHEGSCRIIAIMSGDFTQQGLPAQKDKYQRAARAIQEGVDMVVELPVYSSLSSPDTYAFAAVSLLESLHCIDTLYLACDTKDTALLLQTARFLFAENIQYQKTLKNLRLTGMSFYDAQALAAEKFIPGAKEILKSRQNAFAAEYIRSLMRLYSRIKPCLIPIALKEDPGQSAGTQGYLTALLDYTLKHGPKDLDEISGGTAALTAAIRHNQPKYDTFENFCRQLATPSRSPANIRRYMLSAILNLRKSDMALCRLYSFALYIHVLAIRETEEEMLLMVKTRTRLPILYSNSPEADAPLSLSVRHMAAFDQRAHMLYSLAFPKRQRSDQE